MGANEKAKEKEMVAKGSDMKAKGNSMTSKVDVTGTPYTKAASHTSASDSRGESGDGERIMEYE